MFIGCYMLDGTQYNNIYYKNSDGFRQWYSDTFSPTCENIMILDLSIHSKTYRERQAETEDKAKEWQSVFSQFSWSWGELAEIQNYFYTIGKRYGLLKEFKENAIC